MKNDKPGAAAVLRLLAEEYLQTQAPPVEATLSTIETQGLLHELQVHQIELEMQNDELRDSRARLETAMTGYTDLYDFAPVVYLTLSHTASGYGVITNVNLAGARLMGLERANLIGKRFGAFVVNSDLPVFNAFLQRVFTSQTKQFCELELGKNGQALRNVQIEASLSGNGQECYTVLVDISERIQAQAALRESERLLHATLDALPEHICVLDQHGTILITNLAWDQFASDNSGDLKSVMTGVNYLAVCDASGEDASAFGAGIRSVIRGERDAFAMEYACHAPGEQRWFVGHVTNFKAAGSLRVVVAHENITNQKLAEAAEHDLRLLAEALRDSVAALNSTLKFDEVLERILENVGRVLLHDSVDIILLDDTRQHGQIVRHRNIRFPELQEQVVGMQFSMAQMRILREMQITGAPVIVLDTGKYAGWFESSSTDWVRANISAPIIIHGETTGFLSLSSGEPDSFSVHDGERLKAFADQAAIAIQQAQLHEQVLEQSAELEKRVAARTADLQLANLELGRAARMKDEFLASMSHELRTPLTGILGLSQVLQLKTLGPLTEKQLRAVNNIESSGQHLLELINDILDLSKIEAGMLDVQIDPCSLADICRGSLQLVRGMAQKKNLITSYASAPEAIILRADGRRLKQMLINLLSNAVKFTPEGGSLGIEVAGNPAEQRVNITVWDTGIGIKEEDLPRLFQPFVQLDAGLSRQYSGTGLGLALVQGMAALQGGSVTVESSLGAGSRFTICLPRETKPVQANPLNHEPGIPAQQAEPAEQAANERYKILIADDDEIILEMLADFLETQNFQVTPTHGGNELLACVETKNPDILLVDIQMPDIDGLEVIRRIRAHSNARISGLPVIAVTALAMAGDRERCLAVGANVYLSKPMKLKMLVETIRGLCRK